jgi:3-hydroxyisobutyrate dehydrogenase-like beta-hydroxyacid dehydrogenase
MAGHLVDAGHEVTVWNRTASKAEPLRAQGAQVAASLADLASRCEIVCLCVNRSEDVRECVSEMTRAAKEGTLFVDHSTIAPSAAIEIASELKSRFRFLDAPITGGSVGAQRGTLTIFCGGERADFEEASPVLGAYGKNVAYVGPQGNGQKTKMANQIAVGGSLLALCESLAFAKKAGLDIEQTLALISKGAAGSWAMDNYGPKIVAHDWSPGFSVNNQRKDFGYCKEAATEADAAIPGTELVDALLKRLEDQEHGEWTTAALFDLMVEMHAEWSR